MNNFLEYIIILLIIAAALFLVLSTNILMVYCGIALVILIMFLTVDFYYRRAISQAYEEVINKLTKLLETLLTLLK